MEKPVKTNNTTDWCQPPPPSYHMLTLVLDGALYRAPLKDNIEVRPYLRNLVLPPSKLTWPRGSLTLALEQVRPSVRIRSHPSSLPSTPRSITEHTTNLPQGLGQCKHTTPIPSPIATHLTTNRQ